MKQILGLGFSYKKLQIVSANLVNKTLTIDKCLSVEMNVNNFFSSMSIEEQKKLVEQSISIKQLLRENKLSESDARVVVPDSVCALQLLNLPLVSEKEIISAIEFQAEEFIPYSLEKASYDHQIIAMDEKNKQMSVFVVATTKDAIDKTTELILDLGLFPEAIEPQSTALYRLFFDNYLEIEESLIMLINCSNQASQVSIIDVKNKQLVMTLSLNIGAGIFIKSIQNNLNCSFDEAIKQLESMSFDSTIYKEIFLPIFKEYKKDLDKLVQVANQRIGLSPQKIYLTSLFGQKILEKSFNNLDENTKIQTVSLSILNKKLPLINIENLNKEKLNLDEFLPVIATLI